MRASTLLLVLWQAGCQPPAEPPTELPEAPWPEWTFRHWVWEDESTAASATALVDGYLARDIPVGAIIIDSPWATGYNTFEFDPALFPDPQGFVDGMHDRDVRVMLWVVPAINVDEVALWQEAADAGYFMQSSATSGPGVISWWKGEGSLLDYFNPDAVAWWHAKMAPALALGIDGWKCDGLDFSVVFSPYSPGLGRTVERLEYSHAYYQDFHDHTRAVLGDDRIVTARPVDNYGTGLGGEAVAFAPVEMGYAGWVGDQDADFGGLRAALENMYESSLLGYVAFGSDIGGYREDPTYPQGRGKELLLRWAQAGAFSPVMENGGGGLHEPWAFDEETVTIYRRFVRLHHALLPYLHAEGAVAYAQGRSLLSFTDAVSLAWRLGPDVFVAPVLVEGATQVDVTFPAGRWRSLFDPVARHQGGETATVDVPLDELPVFVREGAPVWDDLRAALTE